MDYIYGNSSNSYRMLLVSDHPLVCGYLQSNLKSRNLRTMTERQVDEIRSDVWKRQKLVVIIDGISMGKRLAALLRKIRALRKDVRTLVIHRPLPEDELYDLLSSGMDGFVPFNKLNRDLLKALNTVCKGKLWLNPELITSYIRNSRPQGHGQNSLSFRENEVVQLLTKRLSNKEIAVSLNISDHTVKFHLARIYKKLGVPDRYSALEFLTANNPRHPAAERTYVPELASGPTQMEN